MCFIVFKQFAENNEIALRLVAMSVAGLLAYADDIVLLAPSWRGLQQLLDIVLQQSGVIYMSLNARKSVSIVFTVRQHSLLCRALY